jgi:sortase A
VTEPAEALLGATPVVGTRGRLDVVRRTVRELGVAMMALGVIILAFVVYQLWGTSLAEQHSQHLLGGSFEKALVHNAKLLGPGHPAFTVVGGRDLSPSTPAGVAVDHLVIPAIHVDKFVVQGTAEADLDKGPGHYVDTPMPGQRGNAAIAGHRTTYGAPFFELDSIRPGARIYLTDTAGRTFDYRVTRKEVVSPNDVAVLDDTPYAELTLTTCNPPYSATSRLVVVARLVGRPLPTVVVTGGAGAGAAGHSPALANTLGRGNGRAWPPAVAYGAAAAVVLLATRLFVARTRRWRRLAAFVAGVAVCAVPLWFCFENVVRLLPQNI